VVEEDKSGEGNPAEMTPERPQEQIASAAQLGDNIADQASGNPKAIHRLLESVHSNTDQ